MKHRIIAFICGVSTVAIAMPAYGQTVAASGEQVGLADIIVTAQRRAERSQDVPIVITALSSEALQERNISQPQDLYGSIPSLTVGAQGQATRDVQSFAIRGQSTGFLSSPAVAVYINDVPVPASITLNLQGAPGMFHDLENVQVLSGPQGTLFGRNTTGGAVLFVTRKPSEDFNGYLEGGFGNYDMRSVEGAVNVPVVDDRLMVRLSGAFMDRDGYTRDLVFNKDRDDQHWYTGRLSILFKPADGFESLTTIHGSKSSNNGSGFILEGFNVPLLQAYGFCDAGGVPCSVYSDQTDIQKDIGPRATRSSLDGFSKIESWGIINNSSYEFSSALTIRNIFSYQTLKDDYAADQDASPLQQYENAQGTALPSGPIAGFTDRYGLPIAGYLNRAAGFNVPRDNLRQITNELQFQGSVLEDRLSYSFGGFYYKASPRGMWGQAAFLFCPPEYTGLCPATQTRVNAKNSSTALYGQATLDFGAFSPSLEKLRLTAGYRYTWDKLRGQAYTFQVAPDGQSINCQSGFNMPGTTSTLANYQVCGSQQALNSKAPTWTIVLDYKPTSELLVYGKVSRGYKAGGINLSAVRRETATFEPERLTTYEAGFKSDWMLGDVPLHWNGAYYYSRYNNIQRPGSDVNLATGVAGSAVYAAEATIQGFETQVAIRPVQGIEIGGNLSYTHAKYDAYNVPAFTPTFACGTLYPAGSMVDNRCSPFQYVTPWIYSLHASAEYPLPQQLGRLSFYAAFSHVSSQYTAPVANVANARLQGYGLLNGSLSWKEIAGSGVDATLFVSNVTNKDYRVSNSNVFEALGVDTTLYGEPRTYGLRLRYAFGG